MIATKKAGRPSKKPSALELSNLYAEMTAKEIASRYKVTEQTVRRWITEYRKEGSRC